MKKFMKKFMRKLKDKKIFKNYVFYFKRIYLLKKNIFFNIFLFTLAIIIVPLTGILMPKFFIKYIVEADSVKFIYAFVIFMGADFFAYFTSTYYSLQNQDISVSLVFKFQERIQKIAMTMPYENLENKKILNNMESAKNSIAKAVYGIYPAFPLMVSSAVLTIIYVSLVAQFSPWLVVLLLVNVAINVYMDFRAKKYEMSKIDEMSEIGRKKEYAFSLMYDYKYGKEVRAFSIQYYIANIFLNYKNQAKALMMRVESKKLLSGVVDFVFTIIREGFVYIILIYLYLNNGLTIDDFVMNLGIVASFNVVAQNFVRNISELYSNSTQIGVYRKFISEYDKNTDDTNNKTASVGAEEGFTLRFDNVSFKYPNTDRYILRDFSYEFKAGSHTAIVGLNGAGKSTIVKLICRLFESYEGIIMLNGRNIIDYSNEEYLRNIACVFQDSKLLALTIKENISIDDDNDEKLMDVLDSMGIIEKVTDLKNGVNTFVSKRLNDEGTEFSGGEIQKLLLSRALYKDVKLIILDEPTAALDAIAEHELYENFGSISLDKTAIFISHRMNSTKFCDDIILLENGSIKELGSHEILYALNGTYTEMFNTQAHYYQTDKVVN